MVFRHISRDLKLRSLWMLDNGYLPDEIQPILNVSDRSVRHWAANIQDFGNVIRPQNALHGWPHTLTATQIHAVIDLVNASPEMYLNEIRDLLALEHDVLVTVTTLHDVICAAGLTFKLLRRQAME
ncbi:hypothetical protein M422DRAFT_253841 [Sphaerobolus stellatus SS14]|uniref:Uncharacterized protein n=1 Tax=Sphaerobolus stellatus (strain SS14) TaxID=990650 RepID=A0A0C9VXC3_SPHS4|nr:hypothetical protein M422DRAFT_253841 [Sphaerobolus stellatus SS14]